MHATPAARWQRRKNFPDQAQVLAAFTQLGEPGAHGSFVIHDQ